MEVLSSIMGTVGHFFMGVIAWKVIFALVVIASALFNVACWLLEGVSIWVALAEEEIEHSVKGVHFRLLPKVEMVVILIGVILVVVSAMSVLYAQAVGMAILGVVGIILLGLMSKRVKKVALAAFYLVLDMGLVLIVRALIIGDGSSEAMIFGTSIVAGLASVAITMMRGGQLAIENGKYVLHISKDKKEV